MLPVIEMFTSIQGEGMLMGRPSIFVRVSGCNLRCCFKGSICDTPYSSYNPEKSPYQNMEELVNAFNELYEKSPLVKDVVITGGEPLLYPEGIIDFLTAINSDKKFMITIETNGTLPPLKYPQLVDLYSISPKLSTSVGDAGGKLTKAQVEKHNKTRYNPKNLLKFVINNELYYDVEFKNSVQFKFVYSGKECVDEIETLYKDIETAYLESAEYDGLNKEEVLKHLRRDRITMLMPEGITNKQLQKTRKECVDICVQKGWYYTDRLQILIWGDKRGV